MSKYQITLDVPEKVLLAEKTDPDSFGRELLLLAAVKLYELGRLSTGRAAELAGMSRVEFLLALGRYKVFPFQEELHAITYRDVLAVRKRLLYDYGGLPELLARLES